MKKFVVSFLVLILAPTICLGEFAGGWLYNKVVIDGKEQVGEYVVGDVSIHKFDSTLEMGEISWLRIFPVESFRTFYFTHHTFSVKKNTIRNISFKDNIVNCSIVFQSGSLGFLYGYKDKGVDWKFEIIAKEFDKKQNKMVEYKIIPVEGEIVLPYKIIHKYSMEGKKN